MDSSEVSIESLEKEDCRLCPSCKSTVPLSFFYAGSKVCKSCCRRRSRVNHLRRVYGITEEEYWRIYHLQEGKCLICESTTPAYTLAKLPRKFLQVDHSHETGEFRGLICAECNKGLGCFKDSPALLQKAIRYLERGEE
jgi:hypothetical protein